MANGGSCCRCFAAESKGEAKAEEASRHLLKVVLTTLIGLIAECFEGVGKDEGSLAHVYSSIPDARVEWLGS